MKFTIAIIASLLAVVGNVPYLRDIIRKRVQPHPYTGLVWTIVSCIIYFGQLAKGAGLSRAQEMQASIIDTRLRELLAKRREQSLQH